MPANKFRSSPLRHFNHPDRRASRAAHGDPALQRIGTIRNGFPKDDPMLYPRAISARSAFVASTFNAHP